jgi:hypothetical protein
VLLAESAISDCGYYREPSLLVTRQSVPAASSVTSSDPSPATATPTGRRPRPDATSATENSSGTLDTAPQAWSHLVRLLLWTGSPEERPAAGSAAAIRPILVEAPKCSAAFEYGSSGLIAGRGCDTDAKCNNKNPPVLASDLNMIFVPQVTANPGKARAVPKSAR